MSMPPLRVAVVADYAEEGWPSMDLVGNMLQAAVTRQYPDHFEATLIRPKMMYGSGKDKLSRLFGRFLQYPRELRRHTVEFQRRLAR